MLKISFFLLTLIGYFKYFIFIFKFFGRKL
uniref:Uncharacterized protein n=1 Tax=Rhizophora mucronata TaxID=61149 RepID=A0A2P2JPU1_RHIMU